MWRINQFDHPHFLDALNFGAVLEELGVPKEDSAGIRAKTKTIASFARLDDKEIDNLPNRVLMTGAPEDCGNYEFSDDTMGRLRALNRFLKFSLASKQNPNIDDYVGGEEAKFLSYEEHNRGVFSLGFQSSHEV